MITHEQLTGLLGYSPSTGDFWLKNPLNSKQRYDNSMEIGTIIYSRDTPYRAIKILGEVYWLHKLAIFYISGQYPLKQVDHINGNTLDNTYNNLREATPQQNSFNRKIPNTNTSGYKGLYVRPGGYQIRVMLNGLAYTKFFSKVKYDNDLQKAQQAAIKFLRLLREDLHGEFTNHG